MDFSDCNTIGDIECKQELLQMSSVFPENRQLYHYTSPQGLEGILKRDNLELRFTRTDCLNDISEGNHIIDYYQSICLILLNSSRIDSNYYDSIINLVPKNQLLFLYDSNPPQLFNGMPLKEVCEAEYISYVFCFSKIQDSLPLWNYYVKNELCEGYSLGFCSKKLKEAFHYNRRLNFISEFVVIEYAEQEKDDILLDFIEALYRLRHMDDINLSKTKRAISNEMFKWRFSFKSECFSHEEEIRLVLHLPLSKDKASLEPFIRTQIRYDDAGIPKHVYASLTKSALRQITISPLFNEQRYKVLEKHTENNGYGVKVMHSKIPIRF